MQVLIEHQEGATGDVLEREMFILRKLIEREKAKRISDVVADQENPKEAEEGPDAADFYICTLSSKTIVYKVCPRICGCGILGGTVAVVPCGPCLMWIKDSTVSVPNSICFCCFICSSLSPITSKDHTACSKFWLAVL